MRHVAALFLIVTAAAGLRAARAGDIYCNNQGRDCSDRPSPGATMVRTRVSPPSASSEAAPTPAANTPTDAGANVRLSLDASRAAVQKDVATSRVEQCKQAKDKYAKAVEARRVYRMNKNGEREYLTDEETDQERLNARLEMERTCGKASS